MLVIYDAMIRSYNLYLLESLSTALTGTTSCREIEAETKMETMREGLART